MAFVAVYIGLNSCMTYDVQADTVSLVANVSEVSLPLAVILCRSVICDGSVLPNHILAPTAT